MSIVYGKRIRLRATEQSDMARFVEWVNDPEVTFGLSLFLPMSTRDEQEWFDNTAKRRQEEKPLAIEIKAGRGWKHIGNCGVFGIDWVARSGELGIMIGDKTYWNKGYGTETMSLLLRHGFETLNLNRIFLRVYASNPRAIRAYEKAGFVSEGTMRQAVFKHGQYGDIHFMSVLRSEWEARAKESQ